MINFKAGEIVAYRYWIACEKGVFSPHTCVGWRTDGEAMENYNASGGHGIYAIKSLAEMHKWLSREDVIQSFRDNWWNGPFGFFKPLGLITGKVRLWGHVEEHKTGYTSQYARIVSLDEYMSGPEFKNWETSEVLDKMREIYKVLGTLR